MSKRSNVQDALTPLLGRSRELEELERLLERRFLVLWGPAGVGKSRLALALAAEASPSRFAGGIWWLDLAACRDTADVCRKLSALLQESVSSVPLHEDLRTVETQLGKAATTLLVLDNAEPLLLEMVPLLERWLASNGGLHCLVTSRQRLRCNAATTFAVEPLSEPQASLLFEARVSQVLGHAGHFDPISVTELMQRLDCLPLAIELAAATIGSLQPSELLARLEPSLQLLQHGQHTASLRASSMRDALASSWASLSQSQQLALMSYANHRGEFELAEAEAITAEASPAAALTLITLWEQAWLKTRSVDGQTRYRFYRAAGELARERLQAHPSGSKLTREFERALLGQARTHSKDDSTFAAIRWLGRNAETTFAVARAATERGDAETAAWALLATSHAANLQGPLAPALDLAQRLDVTQLADPELASRSLCARGKLLARSGRPSEARAAFEQALARAAELPEPGVMCAQVSLEIGNLCRHQGDPDATARWFATAAELIERHDLGKSRVRLLATRAGFAHEQGELEHARQLFEAALQGARALEMPLTETTLLQNLGILELEIGRKDMAGDCFREALLGHQRLGHRRFEGIAEYDLGCLALEADAPAEAQARLQRAVHLAAEVGDRREWGLSSALLAVCDGLLGATADAEQRMNDAAQVLAALRQPSLLLAVDWHRTHLQLTRALYAFERGDAESFATGLETVAALLARGHEPEASNAGSEQTSRAAAEGDEVRFARQLVHQRHATLAHWQERAFVALDGAWFQVGVSARVNLRQKSALQAVLRVLVQQRVQSPQTPVPIYALIRAGWPEQKTVTQTGKNRLHVAIATLRKSGLDAHLVHSAGGYSLVNTLVWSAPGSRAGGPDAAQP